MAPTVWHPWTYRIAFPALLALACSAPTVDLGDAVGCSTAPPTGCECHRVEGRERMFCALPVVWATALSACDQQDMTLLIVDGAEEQGHVFLKAQEILPAARYWLGAKQQEGTRNWLWIDGRKFWEGGSDIATSSGLYTNWAQGELQNNGGCLVSRESGLWDDAFCSNFEYYICEGS